MKNILILGIIIKDLVKDEHNRIYQRDCRACRGTAAREHGAQGPSPQAAPGAVVVVPEAGSEDRSAGQGLPQVRESPKSGGAVDPAVQRRGLPQVWEMIQY